MNYSYYEQYINKNTTTKYDLTAVFEHHEVFRNLILDLCKPFEKDHFNGIVGLDSLGFILGGAAAFHMDKNFIAVRKGGAIPTTNSLKVTKSFIDYSGKNKQLEIRKDSIKPGDKLLIIDDWVETGTQIKMAIEMIEGLGGEVVGISSITIEHNDQTNPLLNTYKCFSLPRPE